MQRHVLYDGALRRMERKLGDGNWWHKVGSYNVGIE